jgi:hypothetical protein
MMFESLNRLIPRRNSPVAQDFNAGILIAYPIAIGIAALRAGDAVGGFLGAATGGT